MRLVLGKRGGVMLIGGLGPTFSKRGDWGRAWPDIRDHGKEMGVKYTREDGTCPASAVESIADQDVVGLHGNEDERRRNASTLE